MEKTRKKFSTRKKIVLTVSIILVIVIVLAVVAVILLNSRIFQGEQGNLSSEINTSREIKEDVVTFLVCGIDDDEGRGLGQRTDLIMYVVYDVKKNCVNILQIPRDTYVENTSTNKINAVFGRKENGGIQGLALELNQLFSLPVDHYATIRMDGFKDLVDAMGGVYMDVPFNIDWGGDLKLDKGPQRLDGAHAEIIVRHRGAEGTSDGNYALGDISRLQVQRLFMAAVMKQVMGLSKTEMLGMIPTLLNYFSTDLTPAEMMGFLGKVNELSMDDVTMYLLPGEGIRPSYSHYSVHLEATAQLLNRKFRPYSAAVLADDLKCIEKANTSSSLDNNQGNLGEILGGTSGESKQSPSSSVHDSGVDE